MTTPDRNAAIWFASDGYDPESKGINGRRVAGASFLKGFFRHADVDEFVSVTQGSKGRDLFAAQLAKVLPDAAHRPVYEIGLNKMAPVGTMYFPAPNYAEHLWKRQAFGMRRYSICGITHTTATQAVMRGWFDLRAGPQAEWDAVICTSRAVHAASVRNIEIADDFLRSRFGHVPPRPQMPVIPLGINCDDFAHDPEAAARLRKRMGWGADDIAVVTVARLVPFGKFDPGPLFVALQAAQERLGGAKRLHFVACGMYSDDHSRKVFEGCAKDLMPDVPFHHLPGDDATARKETLSGGDVFAFPIDNIQETFGLSPIEAMAAGLPVVVSDWDGMRDTVTADVGFRVPTRTVRAEATKPEAEGYLAGDVSYAQYGNRASMLTEVNVQAMADAFETLARDAQLRKRMGQAGCARAKGVYDWRAVIPQMQDLWQELAAIRRGAGAAQDPGGAHNPVGALPMDVFSAYSNGRLERDADKVVFTSDAARLDLIFAARRYAQLARPAESLSTLHKLRERLEWFGEKGATISELGAAMGWNQSTVERGVVYFLKYDLAVIKGDVR